MSTITIEINESLCTSCGACARECGNGKGKARATPNQDGCVECLHCYAVCPARAISVVSGSRETPPDAPSVDVEQVEGLLAARRSTRRFKPVELSAETLLRLLQVARYTPSGGNRRTHEVTVLPRGPRRDLLLEEMKSIYAKMGALFRNSFLKTLLKPFVGPYKRAVLSDPRYGKIIFGLLEDLRHGEDPIFYGAPTVVLFHSTALIPTPKEDCVLAAYALALAAQASGLGTCFVSLAQNAMKSSRKCREIAGLAPGVDVHAVLLLGYPAVRFLRPSPRSPLVVHTAA